MRCVKCVILVFLSVVSGTLESVFLILKLLHCGRSRWWVQFFPSYPCKNWYKNWYLHIHKTYDYEIWRAVTSKEFNSSESNQASAGDAITSNYVTSLDHYISTTTVYLATKHSRMVTYSDGLVPIKWHDPLIMWYCEITWQTKGNIFLLSDCLWLRNLGGWSSALMGSSL